MTEYSVRDSVAIIKLDNAPVNALGSKVRSGILRDIKQANHDDVVKAVVLVGKRGTFCAGADIKEFDGGNKGAWITDIGDYFDKMRKPIVAAIEGVALGGGLELALFCHYRIAVNTARVGQPEVQIGLLPGGGGTIRLPRAAGLKNALEIITTGNHVPAEKALQMGILDQIVSGDILEEGIKFAKSKIHLDTSIVCLRNKHVKVEGDIDKVAEAAMTKVKSKYRGAIAPIFCVRSVMNSTRVPYQRGIELEHQYFQELRSSCQSKAMRYAFFAERAITKWQLPSGGNYRTAKPLPVRSAGVIGAGTMGGGIALCLVTSGIPCVLVEQSQGFLEKGMEIIKGQLMGTVKLGKMSASQAKQCMAILKPSVNIDDLRDVDLVIEAVFEDLKLKREIFEKLDKICKPATILCTNTSTLDIDSIATATRRQDKVVGTHFFAPSYIMKLLENIYGTKTSAETVATVMKLGKTIRKVPVLVGSCTGFVANRMLGPYSTESMFMVEEGSTPQEIDQVHLDFGMPMGRFEVRDLSEKYIWSCLPYIQGKFLVEEGSTPSNVDQTLIDFGMPQGTFQVSDLSGVDVGFRIRREAARKAGVILTTKSRFFLGERNCSLIEVLMEKGRLGKKVGKGWYKYDGPRGKPIVDPEVTQLIEEHCRSLGIERRTIGSQEILERMQYAMINEGFKILEEGLCLMPEEIDIIWIYGFSWPKYMGGPMYYASQIGLKKIYERICYYHRKFPYSSHWVPSSLLAKLSQNNVPFSKWGQAIQGSKL